MLIHLQFSQEMAVSLSQRASEAIRGLDLPWRYALRATYDPDHNPNGLISFSLAENVRHLSIKKLQHNDPFLGLDNQGHKGICGQKRMNPTPGHNSKSNF
jgi:hypothetical protein